MTAIDVTGHNRAEASSRASHDGHVGRAHERTTVIAASNLGPESESAQGKQAGSERERLLAHLEAERARLAAVLQQLPSGVIIAEAPSGRLLHFNEEAARLLRHPLIPPAAVHDAAHDCAIHPDGRSYLPEEYPIARALRGEVVKEENLLCRRATSGVSYLSVNSAPIRDASGRVVAAVCTLHDVSERRRAEVKREGLLRRLVTLQEEERHRIARAPRPGGSTSRGPCRGRRGPASRSWRRACTWSTVPRCDSGTKAHDDAPKDFDHDPRLLDLSTA
jgi:PAS domain-containing protein